MLRAGHISLSVRSSILRSGALKLCKEQKMMELKVIRMLAVMNDSSQNKIAQGVTSDFAHSYTLFN